MNINICNTLIKICKNDGKRLNMQGVREAPEGVSIVLESVSEAEAAIELSVGSEGCVSIVLLLL
jgi:hypothetical protein